MNSRQQSIILFICLILASRFSIGQELISTAELLIIQKESEKTSAVDKGLSFLLSSPQHLPLVEKMEFRTETDEFDLGEQEYLFRMSFNGSKARKAQDDLTKRNVALLESLGEVRIRESLWYRYRQIVDWYYLDMEAKLLQDEKGLLEEKKGLCEKLMYEGNKMDLIEEFLRNEEDLAKLRRDSLHLAAYLPFLFESLGLESNTSFQLDRDDWISVAKMRYVLEHLGEGFLLNAEYALQSAELQFAQSELALETAESKRILDFVQLKHRRDDKLNLPKEFSIGLGINLPIRSTSRSKLNREKLNIFEEERKMERLEEDLLKKGRKELTTFGVLFDEYMYLSNYLLQNGKEEILSRHIHNPNVELLTIFQLKESELKHKNDLLKLERELCLAYLQILELKGVSMEINYLSEVLENISN